MFSFLIVKTLISLYGHELKNNVTGRDEKQNKYFFIYKKSIKIVTNCPSP